MHPDTKTMNDAVESACAALRDKLRKSCESLLAAAQDVQGENEGDTATVSVNTTLTFQFETGKATVDAAVKGSFVERRVTFKTEPVTVGDPDPNQGKLDLNGGGEEEPGD